MNYPFYALIYPYLRQFTELELTSPKSYQIEMSIFKVFFFG